MNSTGFSFDEVTRVSCEPKRIGARNKSRSMLLALTQGQKFANVECARRTDRGGDSSSCWVKTPCSRESKPTSVGHNLQCQVQIGL
jgi:hypothetical protein